MKNHRENVEHYFNLRKEGMDFSEIRKEMKRKRIPDDEIKEIIREIDFRLIEDLQQDQSKQNVLGIRTIGIVLFVGGAFLTLATYLGFINLGDRFVFAYGPMMGGATLFLASNKSKSQHFNKKRGFRK